MPVRRVFTAYCIPFELLTGWIAREYDPPIRRMLLGLRSLGVLDEHRS